MQKLAPSSYIKIKSIMRTPSPSLPDPHQLSFTNQSAARRRLDSASNVTNQSVTVTVPSTKNFDLLPVDKIPKPLTLSDHSRNHRSTMRVAYQGVSESAARKAYPECMAIACNDFEAAFQSVELWIADRAVLPVENTIGGSIHRNYDLLLRHRLNIIGELQLSNEIQDDSSNITRFMILAREPIIPRTGTDRPFKTSIVFAQDKGTSVLYKVLSAFAFRDIKLTKIETRPNLDRPVRVVDHENVGTAKHFEYMFYVDFEASMADVRAQNALTEVQEFTSFLRVLGSYPMGMNL